MVLLFGFGLAVSLSAAPRAQASCRVANQTGLTFTVSSGNVAGQRVAAHATTTVAPGKIQGKSEQGRTIAGACRDGGELVIQEKNGVPLLMSRQEATPPKQPARPGSASRIGGTQRRPRHRS